MTVITKLTLGGATLAFALAAVQVGAEPRSVKVRPDGSTVEIDYKTGKKKDKPVRGRGRTKKDPVSEPVSDPVSDPIVDDGSGDTGGSDPAPEPVDPVTDTLPPLDLSDMALWNWNGLWHASQWDNAFSDVPWRYDRVRQEADGRTIFSLDRYGAPELQAQNQAPATSGLWEADVTLPQEASGLAIAPLWLYNTTTKDEIDFEFVGTKGLQVNIHSYSSGRHAQAPVMIPGTQGWSGRRVRFGIRTDLEAGVIELLVDGELVHSYSRADHPDAFPSSGLKPIISMWTAKAGLNWAETWLGTWQGAPASMVVHGYRFTPG